MRPICKNCIYYREKDRVCEVKLGNDQTSPYNECDELMFLFDFTSGKGPTLFFEPKKMIENGRL